MKYAIAAMLVLGATVWGCGSSERPGGAGGTGGSSEGTGGAPGSGGSGTGGAGTGGAHTGGGGGTSATGGSGGSGGMSGGTTGGNDASADASSSTSKDAGATSGGELWAKCGPEAFKPGVSAADFCARYIAVCKASVSADACATMYNSLSDGPQKCRACTAYYACIASSPDVMAMSCLYIMQGLAKGGPCKPSYCD
jgi:hypothetical protein